MMVTQYLVFAASKKKVCTRHKTKAQTINLPLSFSIQKHFPLQGCLCHYFSGLISLWFEPSSLLRQTDCFLTLMWKIRRLISAPFWRTFYIEFKYYRLIYTSLRISNFACQGSTPAPVSYTHLDVYKRQGLNVSSSRQLVWSFSSYNMGTFNVL